MAATVRQVLFEIARLNTKLADDVQFRKKFEDIIGDTQTGTNKRVLQMRALLRSAGFRSPTRVRIFNDLGETPRVIISYDATDVQLQTAVTLSFTFQLNPGP
ncbi:hypothetical protein ACFQ88_20125 [Paenibacillus sp. NPDC056579]|uniref:hypothetical protein n=1 Tax=unclassified Paenibacillus TaxID=185978 RepID=UPI001EF77B8F|nr:hypothetical protein [Paenibacillus sp. H1-7]ULL13725.1 hypothetical protein DVH26_04255 [Paenibacillus sp. H1-7]